MCGVFGYIGKPGKASKEVLAGLQRLEYRGYDSAGICIIDHKKQMHLIKSVGKVENLQKKAAAYDVSQFHAGIGHTRWATHGGVTEENCHPHTSQSKRFVVIHNGIIENFVALKNDLIKQGYTFQSDTDTEVVVQLFESMFQGDPLATLRALTKKIQGSYGLVFLDQENPDQIFGVKKGSPLVIGIGESNTQAQEMFLSSDYQALIGLVRDYIVLEDDDFFLLTQKTYTIFSNDLPIKRAIHTINESEQSIELGNFPHFMLKEIYEQATVIQNIFRGRVSFEKKTILLPSVQQAIHHAIKKITIIASGTSYHAGLLGKYFFEEYADIPTDVIVSAEFKYKKKFIDKTTLFIFVSQSGETADVLDSLKIVKNQGGNVLGVVNVPGSSIDRITEKSIHTRAGVEIGVASTKAFTAQVTTFLLMALSTGTARNLDTNRYHTILASLQKIPDAITSLLHTSGHIQQVAQRFSKNTHCFFLGRNSEFPIAAEGSLKLKEISYIHCEAYPSGELKHGPIALVDKDFPIVMVNGATPLYNKNISTMQEIQARNGTVIGIVAENDPHKKLYDEVLTFPHIHPDVDLILEVIVLQLFAYYGAISLGREIDTPRNLAKSVTVE